MIELQMKLLGDSVRNEAFERALKKVIIKGKTEIADIGSGTGFLSFLAEKLGAKTCYLYESDADIFELSKKLAKRNGITHCKFYNMHSTDVKNPPKVDVVISETLGNYALEENILETLQDAKRFLKPLKPGGMMIPSAVKQYIAPVTSKTIYTGIDVWSRIGFGLNFEDAAKDALANMYVQKFTGTDLLQQKDAIKKWDEIHFSQKNSSIRTATIDWKIDKKRDIYGFALWWNAQLVPGINLSTSPFEKSTHWDQIFLPLATPMTAEGGKTLKVSLKSDSRFSVGINVSWQCSVS